MKACTLCLQTNTNVCQLGDSAAINFIQEIFVNNGFQELSGHNYICLLCNYLLNKSYNFIQRTLRAQKALKDIVDEGTKITVSTLRQIDRHKLDLDVNLICQEIEINHHIWDSNNNEDNSSAIINPLENITDFNNAFIKNEVNTFGNNTIFPPDYYYNHNYEDVNYNDGYVPNKLDSLDVKTEDITSHVEIKVDIEPYFADIPLIHTRRGRKHVNYEEVTNDCKVKNKNKKAKVIKCEPKEEPDEDGNVKIKPKRQRIKKTGKRERKLKRVDNRKYPMKCDHCRYMIQNKTEHFHHYLLYHQGIQYPYRREGKFMCQHCGIVKTTAHVLHEHELTHGEKKVSCQQCGKLFHNETRLKRHLKRHGAVLKVCDYCNKGFVAREDLILHIRTHTGVKPFKCGICGAGFAHRGNVAIHMRSRHQQEMPAQLNDVATPTQSTSGRGRKRKVPMEPMYYATPVEGMSMGVATP